MDNEKKKLVPILRLGAMVLALAAAGVLLGALAQQYPAHATRRHHADGFSYFTLLRWVTCAASAGLIWRGFVQGVTWTWGMVVIAILFNPLAPVHLDRHTWQVFDVAGAVAFAVAVVVLEIQLRRPKVKE